MAAHPGPQQNPNNALAANQAILSRWANGVAAEPNGVPARLQAHALVLAPHQNRVVFHRSATTCELIAPGGGGGGRGAGRGGGRGRGRGAGRGGGGGAAPTIPVFRVREAHANGTPHGRALTATLLDLCRASATGSHFSLMFQINGPEGGAGTSFVMAMPPGIGARAQRLRGAAAATAFIA
jgi:hypothetical protein